MMNSTIGRLLKTRLKEMGKTQRWLAEQVDVSDNAVSKWIRGGKVEKGNAITVSRLLALPLESILSEDDGLLPSVNSESISGSVESGNAHLPMKPDVAEVDQAVTAVLSMLGWSLKEYLSADRGAGEPRKPRSPHPVRRHMERTPGVPVSTMVERKKG